MGTYGSPKKTWLVILVLVVALLATGWFFRGNIATYLIKVALPVPTTTRPSIDDDAAIHKAIKPYLDRVSFNGTYLVSRPDSKTFMLVAGTTAIGDEALGREIGLVIGGVYLYLKHKGAASDTVLKISITDGANKTYDTSAMGLAKEPTWGEVRKLIEDSLKKQKG
jgi:hypothetical protein